MFKTTAIYTVKQKYRSNGFLSQHSVYRGEAASVLDLQCRSGERPPSTGSECRVEFSTGYPVVNGLRALAIQCAEWKLAPENECRVKIQLWNSSPDGVPALEQSRFCTRIPVRSFLPHRAPSADATFPVSSALGGQ
ncbi:hypothetical protein Bbelb_304180 [Branchiostoma belcheri]|nr:hypothetical protein Bbelb_304180 [Branchiostoma belcheri]